MTSEHKILIKEKKLTHSNTIIQPYGLNSQEILDPEKEILQENKIEN